MGADAKETGRERKAGEWKKKEEEEEKEEKGKEA